MRDETFGQSYTMKIDLQWIEQDDPEDIVCDFRFLNAEGSSIFQRDTAIAWTDSSYIDDYTIVVTVREIRLYIEANGPPATATLACDEDLRFE